MKRRWVRILATLALLAIVVLVLKLTVFRPEAVPVTVFRVYGRATSGAASASGTSGEMGGPES